MCNEISNTPPRVFEGRGEIAHDTKEILQGDDIRHSRISLHRGAHRPYPLQEQHLTSRICKTSAQYMGITRGGLNLDPPSSVGVRPERVRDQELALPPHTRVR